jgi:DNA polymerase-3 subunit delta'
MNEQLEQFQQQLKNGQLAQSFLIVGPEKTGKFFTVVKMIGALNDLNEEQIKSACKGELADIILIETELSEQMIKNKEGEKGNKKLKDCLGSTDRLDAVNKGNKKVKNIISKKQIDKAMRGISLKNFQLKKKIIIIKDADKMTNTAANSLLKLIEEPSSNLAIFLLINNESNIIPTIKSRCQTIRFSFLNDKQIKDIIQKEFSPKLKELQEIIDLAGGRIELAREYATNIKKLKSAQKVRDDFRKALRSGKIEQIKLVDKLIKDETDLLWVINEWIWYLKYFLEENIKNNQSAAVIEKIHTILNSLLQTRELIKMTNASKKVQLENFFIQI